MAVIICKIHGRSFCYAVCSHIIEAKQSNQKPNKIITMRFYFGDFGGNADAPMMVPFNYCRKCIELYDFPKETHQFSKVNLTVEEFDKKFEFACNKFEMVCCKCYEGLMN